MYSRTLMLEDEPSMFLEAGYWKALAVASRRSDLSVCDGEMFSSLVEEAILETESGGV